VTAPTTNELMAHALAAYLGDGEIGFIGVGSSGRAYELVTLIPLMAANLARKRGVDFRIQVGPLLEVDLDNPPVVWDDESVYGWEASALVPSDSNLDSFARGSVSVGFISAAQIDRWGNVNVSQIKTKSGWKRLGGALAVPEHCAFAGRTIVVVDLSPRTFVESVDFVTGFGHRRGEQSRADLQMTGAGPSVVVTDMAIFDFDEGRLRTIALYPDVQASDVFARMAFEPEISNRVGLVCPTSDDISIMRSFQNPLPPLVPTHSPESER